MTVPSPKVSILMSCYNSAAFLSEAIKSILVQTFTDFEFILIDDGSTDQTFAIINDYRDRDLRIVAIKKQNTGLTDSLNVGLATARGKWIARLDADDIALPGRLDDQVSFVQKNPDVVLVGSGCIEIDQNGEFVKRHGYPSHHHRLKKNLIRHKKFFPHSSAFFRLDLAVSLGGYNPRMPRSQDWDLWFRLSEKGSIACLPAHLVSVRKHTEQISSEDRGLKQRIIVMAATVCHILRSRQLLDPSASDDATFKHFLDWITIRLEQKGHFEQMFLHSELTELRRGWHSQEALPFYLRGLSFTKKIITHPQHSLRIARERIFGSNLPVQLASEWIHLTGNSYQQKKKASDLSDK